MLIKDLQINFLPIDTPTVVDCHGNERPVVARFNRKITRDGNTYIIEVTIYEVRGSGYYPVTVPAPFASLKEREIKLHDQWCEYQLTAEFADSYPVDGLYDSLECDNGVEDQRPDLEKAIYYAYSTIGEIEKGESDILFAA